MGRRRRAALLPTNLPQLQNLIKRDPSSYQEEFMQQWKHFESSLVLLKLKPDDESKKFSELVMFLAQVCHCYTKQCATFPDQLIELLQEQYSVLHFELRRSLVQCLILLRNKNFIPGSKTLALFFTLFRCHDKVLRELLYKHIVSDIRTANLKHKNNKLNKTLQNFMFTMLQSVNTAGDSNRQASSQAKVANGGDNAMAAKKSLDVCIELYRKNVWNDAKTVNIIATACFSPVSKILATAIKFFLGCDDPEQDGSDTEDEDAVVGRSRKGMADLRNMQHRQRVGKKTRSKARQYDRALAMVKRQDNQSKRVEIFNFSAIHLINDPQQFADRLYGRLHQVGNQKHSTVERFEVRLMIMKLISRLIGTHQLLVLSFYPFLMKYIQPHQVDVTQILALLAQASHPLVPPDVIEPVIMTIANRFVTDNCSPEVMAAGINSIRAVCTRCPLAMPQTLLEDLTEYKAHRDKGVMMAARSLIVLFREVNPEMLRRRDRGKAATMKLSANDMYVPQFGEVQVNSTVDGADLLEEARGEHGIMEEGGSSAWETQSEADSDNEGWVNVSQSGDENIVIAESDEEVEEAGNPEEGETTWVTDSEGEVSVALESEDEFASAAEDLDQSMDDDEAEEADSDEETVGLESVQLDKPTELRPRIDQLRILTPHDFRMINELKLKQKAMESVHGPKSRQSNLKRRMETVSASGNSVVAVNQEDLERVVDASEIIGDYRKKPKATYEERMESIQAGREGRPKFASSKRRKHEHASSSNLEKKKHKAYTMILHKKSVVLKNKISLREKQRLLRGHIKRQKRKGH